MTTVGWLLVALLPWIAVGVVVMFGIRDPRPLPANLDVEPADGDAPTPTVTVVVPARNEARNIQGCLTSLSAQEYPSFSVVVVDDRSTDETGALARAVPPEHAGMIRVMDGEPLPNGWFGKPWACFQGARDATTELLLFTDADTRHHASLLRRSVQALGDDEADALSLIGRQELRTFWERLLQPQVFALLGLRFRRMDRPLGRENSRDAIANGQYLLVRREAYVAVAGHSAVASEVVEDLRLAQILTASGFRLTLRDATEFLSTRMYESLAEIVEGWTKNLAVGARQAAGWWSVLALPAIVGFLVLLWMVPPTVLASAGARALAQVETARPLVVWSGAATLAGLALWARLYARFEVPFGYALLFPFGSAVAAFIVLRSWVRGERRIEWKGRRYVSGKRIG